MEDWSFSCDVELETLKTKCRKVAHSLGLIAREPLHVPDLQYVNEMAEYIRALPKRVLYQYEPNWYWKGHGGLIAFKNFLGRIWVMQ